MKNVLKLLQDLLNFKYQISQCLSLPLSDDHLITKLTLNFLLNFAIKLLDVVFCLMLFYVGGFSLGMMPMVHIFVIQSLYQQTRLLWQEVDKFRKFRAFLRNVNNEYPLVVFRNEEQEECAICKEVMIQARKLPCSHCFHWFCIIQLIESGSKNCPICRAEFSNNR